MLIKQKHLEGIQAGKIRCAFRCWVRPTVKAGSTLRTTVGLISVDALFALRRADLTEGLARRAGYATLKDLTAELRGRPGRLYRIDLHYKGPDPRIELRQQVKLTKAELEALIEGLKRMDTRSGGGPWTRRVLELLRDNPGVRAGDLAKKLKRETETFKRDVRKLKELGLSESLEVGYRLSPRGARVLRAWS